MTTLKSGKLNETFMPHSDTPEHVYDGVYPDQKNGVILLGLDGATWDLLKPWVEQGYLPTLKKLIDGGVHGDLQSTIPPLTGPAWVSFATGKNPGEHGCYDFSLPKDSLDNLKTINTKDINGKTFYEIFDEGGRKCTLINMPCSFPPRIDGTVITDFLTVGNEFIFPPKLLNEIPELKKYRIMPNAYSNIEDFINDVRNLERNRFECAKKLFEKEWDLFFILFSGTDWIQHKIYDQLISGNNVNAIQFYKEIDEYIGWFVNNRDNSNIMIMSDHGFNPYKKKFAVNKWLMNEGYLSVKSNNSKNNTLRDKSRVGLKVPAFILNNATILKLCSNIYKLIGNIIPITPIISTEPDSRSIAYSIHSSANGNYCSIYINSKMRFNNGVVEVGDYEHICNEIMNKLKNLSDENGKIFKSVLRGSDIYSGERVDRAPDIVLMSDGYNISPFYEDDKIANEHALNGIFVAYGDDIKNGDINNAEIIDLAPTILHMVDMPIPKDMDGHVLTEIFCRGSAIAQREIVHKEYKTKSEIGRGTLKNRIGNLKQKRNI